MKIALGTAQFGMHYGIGNEAGQVSRVVARSMLAYAKSNGVDILDTAISYGDSENSLGEAGVAEFKIVSKLPPAPHQCKDVNAWVQQQVVMSLERLRVTTIYGLLLHRPDQLLEWDGPKLYGALRNVQAAGLVQKIGISIQNTNQLNNLIPSYSFDLVQGPLNLIDRRLHVSGWLKRLKDSGVEVHTRSVFLQGLLLMKQSAIPPRFAIWTQLLDGWHKWLTTSNESAVQTCLAYPLSIAEVDRVVVGADSLNHLMQILSAGRSGGFHNFPDLQCEDENLINPALWSSP